MFGIFYWSQGLWWTWQQVKDLVVQVVMDVRYLVGSSSMLMLSLTWDVLVVDVIKEAMWSRIMMHGEPSLVILGTS